MPINILCNNLSLYEYRGNLYLIQDLRKINVLKKKSFNNWFYRNYAVDKTGLEHCIMTKLDF